MVDKVVDWFTKPAHWSQWWLPQSGVIGGLLLGIPVGMVVGFTVWLCLRN